MENNSYIDKKHIKSYSDEEIKEITDSFINFKEIKDAKALTIIKFLVDQAKFIINSNDKFLFKQDMFNFIYYLLIGINIYYSEFTKFSIILLLIPSGVNLIMMTYYKIFEK